VSETLGDLQAAFRAALAERVAALDEAGRALRGGSADAATAIRRMAHALRGVGGTYGFPEVSEAAAACEEADEAALLGALDGLQTVLRRVAAGGAAERR
jgi:chemotaxis protein histidine kinase CheA